MFSLIIPVYKNSKSLGELLQVLEDLNTTFNNKIEFVFVIDGNPENEFQILKELLPKHKFKSQLIAHSKNFGSFAAIKTGLENANGDYFATLAADLQEPPELIEKIFKKLSKEECDIVIANRISREDNPFAKFCSNIFWNFYRKYIIKDIPKGGVDLFGCNKRVRDSLISLKESNTSLVGLLFWVGFRRQFVGYKRNKRKYGKSAWNIKRKIKYMTDSIFAFSDLPIKILILVGILGFSVSLILSVIVLISKFLGGIPVPGYTATLLIGVFFSSINMLSFGIIGLYIWRTFENTKNRPNTIIMEKIKINQK